MRLKAKWVWATVTAMAVSLCVGCSGQTGILDPQISAAFGNSPYQVEFEQAFAEAKSDFVKKVLADGQITPDEFRESQAGLISCFQDGYGEPFLREKNGFTQVLGYPINDDGKCTDEWLGNIGLIFNEVLVNPRRENFNDLIVQCLIRMEFVPKGFTREDYEELDGKASEISDCSPSVDEDGHETDDCTITKPVENPNPKLPSGEYLYSDKTEGCLTNPLATKQE